MLRKLVHMIGDKDYINTMSHSGKTWNMTIEDFLGGPMRYMASYNEVSRLRRIFEAIQTVRSQKDTASVRYDLLLVSLHAAVETIRAANLNRPDPKSFSRRELTEAASSGELENSKDLSRAFRAGKRIARLFKRNAGILFSLKADAEYM